MNKILEIIKQLKSKILKAVRMLRVKASEFIGKFRSKGETKIFKNGTVYFDYNKTTKNLKKNNLTKEKCEEINKYISENIKKFHEIKDSNTKVIDIKEKIDLLKNNLQVSSDMLSKLETTVKKDDSEKELITAQISTIKNYFSYSLLIMKYTFIVNEKNKLNNK